MTASSLMIGPDARPETRPAAGVRRFLAWWSGELSDVVAARAAKSRAWRVMILRSERGTEVYLRSRDAPALVATSSAGLEQPLTELARRVGRGKVAPVEIVLRLQPGEVVQTRLSVPAAAGDVLEPVVRNQIERLAPWPADKALFAYETAPAEDGSATLDVRLAVAARSLVDGLVAELEALGFAPGVVDFGADATAEPRLNLLSAQAAGSRRAGRRILSFVGLMCAASIIAGALGAAGLVQQTRELDAVNARLQELHDKSSALLPSQANARRQAWLAAQRLAQPSMAVTVEALSRALPDDAWLNRLEVEQGTVRLAGNAGNASALIGQIEASGHFADVQFSAPTTLAEGETQESFTITARIVPGRKLN
jgi:general secretion pathway protein L